MSTTPGNPGRGDPGFEFKHRITGAVILILFAVIVLPMILGGPNPELVNSAPEPARSDQQTQVFVSKITPIGGATPERGPSPEPQAPAGDAADRPPSEPTAPGAVAKSEQDTGGADGRLAKPQARPPAAAVVDRGWIVQVGVYSKAENAERMRALLSKRGFKPESDAVKTRSKDATRVWIGPFAKRVDAARMRARLEQATGEKGYIVAYP